MDKRVIVSLGSEGGRLLLVGLSSEGCWEFRAESEEATLTGLLNEEVENKVPERPWVATWASALMQLDSYPWPRLHPIYVHNDFQKRVLRALQRRERDGLVIDWVRWTHVLERDARE